MDNFSSVLKEDIRANARRVDLRELEGHRVLITGGTGLIGYSLVSTLLEWNQIYASEPIHIMLIVRNEEKARKMYGEKENLQYLISDIERITMTSESVDYIIHMANPTSSKMFVTKPVEVIKTAVNGTINLMDLAVEKKVLGAVYLSTMEIYGVPEWDERISEDHISNLDHFNVRASYPESKKMCETVCLSYYSEYNVPVKILRLTQTFGPGVKYDDGRVFAEFARSAIENRDIILKTEGKTKREYLYTADAVCGILLALIKGKSGNVYNLANEETYCSIREMAELVADRVAGGKIKVRMEIPDNLMEYGYAAELSMNLVTEKIQNIGWEPQYDLQTMYCRMIEDMINQRQLRNS